MHIGSTPLQVRGNILLATGIQITSYIFTKYLYIQKTGRFKEQKHTFILNRNLIVHNLK